MGSGFDPNNPDNLSVYEKSVHAEITKKWADFKRAYSKEGKEPTKEEIVEFEKKIEDQYKDKKIK